MPPTHRITYTDGHVEEVNLGRPALLYAFEVEHGRSPGSATVGLSDAYWLAHRTLANGVPLVEWLEELEEVSAIRPAPDVGEVADAARPPSPSLSGSPGSPSPAASGPPSSSPVIGP